MKTPLLTSLIPILGLWLTAWMLPASCARVDEFPGLGEPTKLGESILLHEVSIVQKGLATRLWIYLPVDMPKGEKLPCVLIAPAGTGLWHGMGLGEGDRPEHLPYVEAGCIVVAYTLSGPVVSDPTDEQFNEALGLFMNSDGGVNNAKAALDYAFSRLEMIDKAKVFTAGHSSAGTASLQVAAQDKRIKGCIAFAPVSDLENRLEEFADMLANDLGLPELKKWAAKSSPLRRVKELECPVFLFHAEDDQNILIAEASAFHEALVAAGNKRVKFVTTKTGGHYQSMIDEGVPQAIEWLKKGSR